MNYPNLALASDNPDVNCNSNDKKQCQQCQHLEVLATKVKQLEARCRDLALTESYLKRYCE